MAYEFKVWGFGEDICLRALLEFSRHTGDVRAAEIVVGLVRPWCVARLGTKTHFPYADHVAPGVVILDLHETTGDEVYLAAALELGELHRSFPEVGGVAVHRPDLKGLNNQIWVDCMALDAPFLARLARVTADEAWRDLAITNVSSYTSVLHDPATDLFRHGFDARTRTQSDCNWARGNGWAMHGLIDTIAELPASLAARAHLTTLLERQVSAVLRRQATRGAWHTVLDDFETPLEYSAAAFFASGVSKALRLGLLDAIAGSELDLMLERAVTALLTATSDDGSLPISFATPVGTRDTYVNAPLGVFPWGQGPLLLTLIEAQASGSLGARRRTGGITA